MSSEIIAALLGALAAGGWQTIVSHFDRRRRHHTILASLAAEVAAICTLVRAQRYLEQSLELAALIPIPEWQASPSILVTDVRESYFAVFDALASEIGSLRPTQAMKIVTFYQYCRSAVDSHRPDGVIVVGGSPEESAAHIRAGVALFEAILRLGDDIVQMTPERLSAPILRLAQTKAQDG